MPALWLSRKPAIPLEDVTLIFGPGAIGKGRVICSVIAAVTTGRPVGMDEDGAVPGDVITITPEDRAGRDMRPRLESAGADMARVHDMTRLDGGGRFKLSATPSHPGHLSHLRGYLEQIVADGGNPRLVVIDPVSKVVGWGNITTKAGANHLTECLQDFAEDTGVAVILVAHTTKDGKLEGSAGMMQGPRLVYRLTADPSNDALRVLSVEKANNLPPAEDLRFMLTEGDNGVAHVEWLDREKLDQRRQARRGEAATVTPAQAIAAGCSPRHAGTRFGTARMCGDCRARRLLSGTAASQPARPAVPQAAQRPAAAPAAAGPARESRPLVYASVCATPGPAGGQPVITDLGSWPSLAAAQAACQGAAGAVLSWRQRNSSTTVASAPGAGFAISLGTGR